MALLNTKYPEKEVEQDRYADYMANHDNFRRETAKLYADHEDRRQKLGGLFWALPETQYYVDTDPKDEPYKLSLIHI